jgi:hypothetical protein
MNSQPETVKPEDMFSLVNIALLQRTSFLSYKYSLLAGSKALIGANFSRIRDLLEISILKEFITKYI